MSQFNDTAEAAYSVQDYGSSPAIEGVELIALRRFNDDGGSMTELARLAAGQHEGVAGFEARQMNYSVLDPQAIKAFHLHRRQTDVWFVPPSDKIMLVLADVRSGSASEGVVQRLILGDGNSRLVRIPPGVAHGCRNLRPSTPGSIIYFVDVQFSVGEECDEGRLPWDHFGTELWEVERA
ncbi:MAG: dTDP-4-dehydrorhamnose 3,5-epimerase family protein [Planctomycetota bacterium]|jgi:dTDP-4-dehydrorhamnose 3,5-epimerase|nr:dTDP-4-dehydrorhamnose 3,5-epimerase family protein [Planctomycetota bacterium]MDP6839069.1 dTDP-4-dehydrorhamnose 3,5-epimerase family protein [Planctomycetota bacterium]